MPHALAQSARRLLPAPLRRLVGACRGGGRGHRARAELRGARLARRIRPGRAPGEARRQRRIAIALVDHFGDIVAAEPIVRHLRETEPGARLCWVVSHRYRELVDAHPGVDETIAVGCLTEWIELKRRGRFDRIVDLHVDGRGCERCNVQIRRRDPPTAIHIGNYYAHGSLLDIFCTVGGLPALRDGPRVHIPPAAVEAVDRLGLPERFVSLHGRSNQEARDWSDAKWRQLAERLADDRGIPLVEVGIDPVLPPGPNRTNLSGRLTLLETAEVIRRSALFTGIDSGPAHLANATRTPGVLLLGHYRAYRTYMPYSGPYRDGSLATILRARGPASSLSVDAVADAVLARWRARSPHRSPQQPAAAPPAPIAEPRP